MEYRSTLTIYASTIDALTRLANDGESTNNSFRFYVLLPRLFDREALLSLFVIMIA